MTFLNISKNFNLHYLVLNPLNVGLIFEKIRLEDSLALALHTYSKTMI